MGVVKETVPLGFVWQTADPFLFCVHHDDAYPAGNEQMGPATSLAGRDLGQDFEGKDGFRMYHGRVVPGFPQHPHRGFETVTIVRRGLIDHSDSLGAAARFGGGDVQWLTAGRGVVHSEMFPLLDREKPNPVELFQIWLNLPKKDKMAPPHFEMLWGSELPRHVFGEEGGPRAEIVVIAGAIEGKRAPSPPPSSWASDPRNDVAIWTLKLDPKARVTLPRATDGAVVRTLYFFGGDAVRIGGREIGPRTGVVVASDRDVEIEATAGAAELLMLQGRPIAEPVVQRGPFVMNQMVEIQQAMMDYQRTRFGGWPWPKDDPVHPRAEGRFARHVDGRIERGR